MVSQIASSFSSPGPDQRINPGLQVAEKMAPSATIDTAAATTVAVTKAQLDEEVVEEVTPLEAISHGDILPGKSYSYHRQVFKIDGPKWTREQACGGEPRTFITSQKWRRFLRDDLRRQIYVLQVLTLLRHTDLPLLHRRTTPCPRPHGRSFVSPSPRVLNTPLSGYREILTFFHPGH